VRVLDGCTAPRIGAEAVRRFEIDVGRRLSARDFLGRDGRFEATREAAELEREVDQLAVRRRRETERPLGGEPTDRLGGAGQQRQVLAIALLEPADDLRVDLVRRLAEPDDVVHVARPLRRAHAHHVPLRAAGPAAASLLRELFTNVVPDLLAVEQNTVHVEDHGRDHAPTYSWST
jgi:hypothetical protein